MKALRLLLLSALLWCVLPLRAQTPAGDLEVTRATAEELIRFLQREVDPGIFFLRDTTDANR